MTVTKVRRSKIIKGNTRTEQEEERGSKHCTIRALLTDVVLTLLAFVAVVAVAALPVHEAELPEVF